MKNEKSNYFEGANDYKFKVFYIILKDIISGEIRRIEENWWPGAAWHWSEGNSRCDCNRAIHFGIKEHPCGDTRFKVIEIDLKDYIED